MYTETLPKKCIHRRQLMFFYSADSHVLAF